jgi:basic membrane protein A and related proteins
MLATRRWTLGVALALVAVLALAVASVGSAKPGQDDVKLAVVTDIGGLNDRSFNQAANKGRLDSEKQLGVQTRVFVTKTAGDRIPNLRTAATQGYNLVFGVGFLMFEPLDVVAPRSPDTTFAGIDVSIGLLKSKPKNFVGIQFKEQEAGYLVGYLAGLTVKRKGGDQVVGAVGANKVPPIVRYIAGYRQGVKKANPGATVLVNYANDPTFADQAKCKEQTLNQIEKSAQVIFQVAGGCGLGVISAAKEAGIYAIGVDVDQAYIAPGTILTSAMKDVAASVVLTTKAFQAGTLKPGKDIVYGIKSGAITYGKVNKAVPKADIAKLEAVKKQIASGKISVKAA